jgi:hypothetical protein
MARMRVGIVVTAAGAFAAATLGFYLGWRGSTVTPSPPAAVCPMVRPELLGRLVPRHGSPADERFGHPGVAGAACTLKTSDVDMDLAVMRFGRHDGLGPIRSAQRGMLAPVNRELVPTNLGEEAWYFVEPGVVYLTARLGATVVQVRYEAPLDESALATSAAALAQEVLAQL